MEEMKHAYGVLVGNTQEKRPVGRSRHRWHPNIKMSLKLIDLYTGLGQGQEAGSCKHIIQYWVL